MTSDLEKRLAGLSPEKRALLEKKMKQLAAKKSKATKHTIPQRTGTGPWPASLDQTALWFFHQLDPETYAYNNGTGMRIRGPLQVPVIVRAANELVRRHEALRTTFTYIDGNLYQKVTPHLEIDMPVTDLRHLSKEEAEKRAFELIPEKLREPFDLNTGPLLYLPLLRIDDEDWVIVVIMHHAVTDWWSFKLFVQELLTVYQAYLNGQPSPLPELPIQFIDYTFWRNEWLKSADFENQMSYWRKQLGGAPLVLDLPTDRPRPAQQDFRGKRLYRYLPKEALDGIRQMNTRLKASSLMTCMSAAFAFLYRVTGVNDLLIGTPTTDREAKEMENMIGYLLNVLIIRAQIADKMTFAQLVEQMKRTILDALANKDLPFRMLAEELNPERELSRMPIYQVDFNHVSEGGPVFEQHQRQDYGMRLPGYELGGVNYDRGISDVDLQINFIEGLDNLELIMEWAVALFDEETAHHFGDLILNLIVGMTQNPDTPIDEIDILGEEQRNRLLIEWNDVASDFPRDASIPDLFAEQVARSPQAEAVIHGDTSITYADLADRSWQLANYLVEQGVFDNEPVGLCLPQGIDWVTGMTAVLAAGGNYVPIDADYPHERIAYMLQDTGMTTLITNSEMIEKLPAMELNFINTIVLDEETDTLAEMDNSRPEVNLPAEGLAYTIYTSGTTGQPKGVQVPQRAVLRLVYDQEYCRVEPGSGVGQASNISFDAHVFEVWTALLRGARLCIIDKDTYINAEQLHKQIQEQGIDAMFITTALFNQHMATLPELFRGINYLLVGGERVDVNAFRRCLQHGAPKNPRHVYGPTETTTFALWNPATTVDDEDYTVPIGRGIANTKVYVLDKADYPAAIGVIGELCIGGPGQAQGYLNAPGLTASRFVPNPCAEEGEEGSRLYRTGDLVKWRRSGVIEFMGRRDNQVKVRGFRIELGEIETALTDHESIDKAVVIVRKKEGAKRIVAYLQPTGETDSVDLQVVRDHLFHKLPEYMLPAAYVVMESFPLTPNGKLDKRALPEPETKVDLKTFEAPRDDTEQKLADVWSSVLGVEKVSIRDNFFDLGGDSILGIQVIAGANRMGLELSTKDLFQYQTIAELSEHVGAGRQVVADQGVITGEAPLTPIQTWLYDVKKLPDHFNISLNLKPERDLDIDILTRAFGELVKHHDALRMRFRKNEDGGWVQVNEDVEGNHLQLETLDLSGENDPVSALDAVCSKKQASLSLSEGPVTRVLYVDLGAEHGRRLVIMVHHMIFDGISVRVMLEDLESLYTHLEKGEEPRLMPKSTSWKYWCERLAEHASAPETLAELSYWQSAAEKVSPIIPVDFPDTVDTCAGTETISMLLTAEQTRALLKDVPSVYNTRINDVLLTALALATVEYTGAPTVPIALEGHGREEIFDDVDFSRTMGWFTCMFPLVLTLEESERTPGAALKAIKEQIRAVPRNGIGYGLLRFINPETGKDLDVLNMLQLNFNYLGQFDADGSQSTLFSFSRESTGPEHAPEDTRGFHFEIVGAVLEGRLSIGWNYSSQKLKRENVQKLADLNHKWLTAILEHCLSEEAGGRTPSDYPYVSLSQEQVDQLHERYPNLENIYPAVPLQAGMLFHTFMEPESLTYREQMDLGLSGDLNVEVYQRSWAKLFERHEALRSVYVQHETGFLQVILDAYEPDLRMMEADSPEALERIKEEELTAPVHLDAEPLNRLVLVKYQDFYRMIWTFHHTALDGWSTSLAMTEMKKLYAAGLQKIEPDLYPPAPYENYIRWLQAQDPADARAYWEEQFKGFDDATLLAFPEPAGREQVRHLLVDRRLTLEETEALESFAREHALTVGTLVTGAWALLLSRYTGRDDVAFGVTGSGRPPSLRDVEKLIGLFINTLPLRLRIQPGMKVKEWLTGLQETQVAGRDFEYSTLADVQRFSEVEAGQPMFDSMMVFENFPIDDDAVESFGGVGHLSMFEQTNYPVTFISGPAERLKLRFRFDADRLPAHLPEQMPDHMVKLLVDLVQDPNRDITQLTMLRDADRNQLDVWSGDTTEYPREKTVPQLFEELARTEGDKPALTSPAGNTSYADLNARANRMAHHMPAQGVGAGSMVGICCAEDNPDMIAAILAVLKTGAAYVPLDSNLPEERLRFIIGDAGIAFLVTETGRLNFDHGIAAVLNLDGDLPGNLPDTNPNRPGHPLQPAYVMYTSGSTGRPKGVGAPHRAIVRLVRNTNYVELGPDKVLLQGSVPSFDASTFEIWGALLNGGRLVLMNSAEVDHIPDIVTREGVTTAWLTSQLFNLMVDSSLDRIGGIQELLVGGDVISVPHMQKFKEAHPEVTLINGYGPTENTTFTCCFNLSRHDQASTPIGRPIANTTAYILDAGLNRMPAGMPGELFMGGDGLAQGYLNSPALTAERFVPNPLAGDADAGSRLYRSGDLVRFAADGVIEFMGRRDNQVKIRGFRIELGEIEHALRALEANQDAVVRAVTMASGDKRLVAWVQREVAEEARTEVSNEIRTDLARSLPDYMLPVNYVFMDQFPLKASGKIDFKALPDVELSAHEYVAPRNEIEQAICDIWCELLELERVGIHDNFFELGAHSLTVTRAVSMLRVKLEVDVPIKALFEAPTAEDLGRYIEVIQWSRPPEEDGEYLDDDEEEGEI